MYLFHSFILYNKSDIQKNKWFIDEMISLLQQNNCGSELITSDKFYSALIHDLNHSEDYKIDYQTLGLKPDFVINRSRDPFLSEILEKDGIRVFNNSMITKMANDKCLTFQYLSRNNIQHLPYTVIPIEYFDSNDLSPVTETAKDFGYPFILKPAEGHGGFMVRYISTESELLKTTEELKYNREQSGIPFKKIILQKPSQTLGRDLRAYILGDEIICSIMRASEKDFRANFSIGGKSEIHILTTEEKNLIKKAKSVLSGDFYGIDLIYNEETPVINEIEDAVGCRMIYENTDINILKLYIDHILNKIKKP